MATLAPNFTLQDQNGAEHTLTDYRGQWVIVYFYPKDDTPGCTKQACGMRDINTVFEQKGIKVLGISADSVGSHKKFDEKFGLGFTLLSDPEKEIIQAFGAWGEKSMYGKKYMGILRNTYLINPDGEIVTTFEKTQPAKHAAIILKEIENLQG